MKYRPWGSVNWALSLSSNKEWHFVGAIGTEKRSLCSWDLMKGLVELNGELFTQIRDVDSDKYRARNNAALHERHKEFSSSGGDLLTIHEMELMTELFKIQELSRTVITASSSVVLDVTSLPKRFFFPLLRAFVLSDKIQNLLVTYSSPASYADGPLYENIDAWKNLPGFGGSIEGSENLIVSIGFLVESLKGYFATQPDHGNVKMLIPFPASLAILKRTWESVSNIERDQGGRQFEKFRVETLDMSAAFDHIVSLASNSTVPTAFAPFGPKPTSVAMCLYAIQNNSAVYYPQPTIYHPDYSKGIRDNTPSKAVTAYWVKHEGENLYAMQ